MKSLFDEIQDLTIWIHRYTLAPIGKALRQGTQYHLSSGYHHIFLHSTRNGMYMRMESAAMQGIDVGVMNTQSIFHKFFPYIFSQFFYDYKLMELRR